MFELMFSVVTSDEPGRLTKAQQRDQTRARLLDCAKELFSQYGYHRTQVLDIVTRAHVSAGTFYRYFDDKPGVFLVITQELSGHEVEEAQKARAMMLDAHRFEDAVRNMVHFLEHHFERTAGRASLYRALHNSGVVDLRHDHAWAMRERAVQALAEELARAGATDTEDIESLARMMTGVISEMRYAMIQTGKPSPAQAARLCTRFLQGGMAAYTAQRPRFPGLFSDEWAEVLEREAPL